MSFRRSRRTRSGGSLLEPGLHEDDLLLGRLARGHGLEEAVEEAAELLPLGAGPLEVLAHVRALAAEVARRELVEQGLHLNLAHAASFLSLVRARWWIWCTAFGSLPSRLAISWKSRSST